MSYGRYNGFRPGNMYRKKRPDTGRTFGGRVRHKTRSVKLSKGGNDLNVPLNTSDRRYINAFMSNMPIIWYDKSQLINTYLYVEKYSPEMVRYVGSVDISSIVPVSDDSKHLVYMKYLYDWMGSGYMNPVYSYREPITELINQHNSLCRSHLAALNEYLAEHKPESYTVLVYIPLDAETLHVPAGEISGTLYGNPDMPTIYITGTKPGELQTLEGNAILDKIFAFYLSGASNSNIPANIPELTDKLLESDTSYGIGFNKEFREFKRGGRDPDFFDIQREAESAHHVEYSRLLRDSDRRMPYRQKDTTMSYRAPHLGQVKLFTSELEFLNEHSHLSKTILYVGAAEGMHTVYMAELYPEHKFILYDPRDFDERLESISNVEIHQQFFTDEDAPQYTEMGVLFICDIRTLMEDRDRNEWNKEFEEFIQNNMSQQWNWHKIMQPAMSMLKFRLPFTPGLTEYLSGDIYYQAYAGPRSTELRLVTSGNETRMYDHTLVEEILYRFNTCTRFQNYDGLYYDDRVLHDALKEYIVRKGQTPDENMIKEMRERLGTICYGVSIEKKINIKYPTQKKK